MAARKNLSSPRRDSIIAALLEHGPMTKREVADLLEAPFEAVGSAIRNGRRDHPGELFYISSWRPRTGKWGVDQPVYAAGAGKDARKRYDKALRRAQANKRYRAKYGEIENAMARARRHGALVTDNPWLRLVPADTRKHMVRMSANSAMREAA